MRRRSAIELVGLDDLSAILLRFGWTRRKSLLVAALLTGLLGAGIVSQIPLETDVLKLLPQGGSALQSFQRYMAQFGGLDELYIVFEAPPDSSITDYTALVERYVQALQATPEIQDVDMAPVGPETDWRYLLDRTMLLLGKEGAEEALRRLEPQQHRVHLAVARELLAVPTEDVRELVQNDPLGVLRMLEDRLMTRQLSVDRDARGYFSRDARSRLVIAKPVRPPYDIAFCRQLAARLTEIERETRAAISEEPEVEPEERDKVQIDFAGAYRVSLEAEEMIHGEMWMSSVMSLVGILVILLLVFRSVAVLVCGTLIVGTASLAAFGVTGLVQGGLLAAATGAAAMLFGLGIDGIILLYTRYLEERGNGVAIEDMPARLSGTGASVILANVTSVATFIALVWIDFPSLQQLGWLVGIGMLFCCTLTLLLVPPFFPWFEASRNVARVTKHGLVRFIERHATGLIGFAALLTILSALAVPNLRVSTRVEDLQPETSGTALNREVMARFGIAEEVLVALTQGRDLDALLEAHQELEERLVSSSTPVSVASSSRLLPPASEQAEIAQILASSRVTAKEVGSALEQAAKEAGFRPGAFRPFLENLPRLLDPSSRLTYNGLLEHGLESMVSRFIRTTPDGFLVVSYLYPGSDVDLEGLQELAHSVDPSFEMTGVSLVNRELAEGFLPEFAKGILIGGVAVVGLLLYVFRSGRLTLLALMPTVLGLIWCGGLLWIMRVDVDLFSAFGMVMVIGIGVDYGIHVVHRLSSDKSNAGLLPVSHTIRAILIAAITTLVALGSLSGASYGPLRSLGVVLVSSILSVLAASVLVLPALLLKKRTR